MKVPSVSVFRLPFSVLLLSLLGCASPKTAIVPVDPDLSRAAATARAAFDRGEAEQAARLYARALRIARGVDDSREIGNNAYNLAACRMVLGDYASADLLLKEAQAEFERAGRSTAAVLLLQAKVARAEGRLDDATALAVQSVTAARGDAELYRMEFALLTAGVACDRGEVPAARVALDGVSKQVAGSGNSALQAEAAGVAARIFLLEQQPAKAAAEYDRQAELQRRSGRYREMAMALGRAGEAYVDAGIFVPAGDRFYRAARSLYAQGDELDALKMVEAALQAAEKSGDQEMTARTAALFEEIRKGAENRKSAK